ncbi:hypothetical protein [uncultured Selenomonas sp.]|nr:hypothetical protein [uncultured Selenomonas sp.]
MRGIKLMALQVRRADIEWLLLFRCGRNGCSFRVRDDSWCLMVMK